MAKINTNLYLMIRSNNSCEMIKLGWEQQVRKSNFQVFEKVRFLDKHVIWPKIMQTYLMIGAFSKLCSVMGHNE